MSLTDTKIRTLKNPDKPVKLADGAGLHQYCSPAGKKYWRMNYYIERKAKALSFGEYPGITLQRAREKRMEARRLLDEGIGPVLSKKPPRRRSGLKSPRPSGTSPGNGMRPAPTLLPKSTGSRSYTAWKNSSSPSSETSTLTG